MSVEVRRFIAASPEKVYDLIADVTRMRDWSPEAAGAEWLTGQPGAVGSTFRGDNQRPWTRWSTICTVTVADPGRRFAFAVEANDQPVSTWEYEVTARPGGCEVVERTVDRRSPFYHLFNVVTCGFVPRSVRNRTTMKQTLAALALAAEASS